MFGLFSSISQKHMDRKQFIGLIALIFVSIFGVGNIINKLTSYKNEFARQDNPEISNYGKL